MPHARSEQHQNLRPGKRRRGGDEAGTALRSQSIGKDLRRRVVVTNELVGPDAMVRAVVERQHDDSVGVDDAGPEVQKDLVAITPRADVVPEYLGGRAHRVETEVLGNLGTGPVKAPGTRTWNRPPGGVVRRVAEPNDRRHAVMAREEAAAAMSFGNCVGSSSSRMGTARRAGCL